MSNLILLRYATSALLLVLACKYAWSQGAAWLGSFPPAQKAKAGRESSPIEQIEAATRQREKELARLKAEQEVSADLAAPLEDPTQTKRIVVDWGPERSQVFIGGTRVGRTPYGGQVSCKAGDVLKVTLLPPMGAPLEKLMLCNESTVDKPNAQQAAEWAAALPERLKKAEKPEKTGDLQEPAETGEQERLLLRDRRVDDSGPSSAVSADDVSVFPR